MRGFFHDESGYYSMSRLLMFMSWFPSTYILLANTMSPRVTELFFIYSGVFVVGYIGGKGFDVWKGKQSDKPDKLRD